MNRTVALMTVALIIIGGCARHDQNPVAPTQPPAALQKPGEAKSSLDLIEDDYAAGLLDRDNASRYRQYAVSAPGKLPVKYRSAAIGKDATLSMVQIAREWNELSRATQEEILELRANGFGSLKEEFITPHFILHFTTQGDWAVPPQDNDLNGISDFIDIAAESWEAVWNREVNELGYPAPKGTPQQKFHVYYQDMPYYGYTSPANVELTATSPVALGTASAWIVVENDFYGFPRNDEDVTGRETIRSGALKVTQAHEFMHASQFNINVYQSGWLMESHATWAEDAVYDGVNDWHWYINYFLLTPDYPLFSRYAYGAAFFMNYVSETYGLDVPRQIWLAARTRNTPNAVRDAAFGGSWEGFKWFAPAEYTLDLSDFSTDAASVVPLPRNTIRAVHNTYPVDVQVPPSAKKWSNRAPWGLGANFVEFNATQNGTLVVSFRGTPGFAWRAFVVATPKNGSAAPSVIVIPLDAESAGSVEVSGFGTHWSKLTLVPTIADRAGAEVPYGYGAAVQ